MCSSDAQNVTEPIVFSSPDAQDVTEPIVFSSPDAQDVTEPNRVDLIGHEDTVHDRTTPDNGDYDIDPLRQIMSLMTT
ncbi:unnamed protein product, partial [Rotaria socialis]